MHIRVVTPKGAYVDQEVKAIHAKSTEGEFTLFQNHLPVVMALEPCKLILTSPENEKQEFAISGGFLHYANGQAILIVDAIEGKREIDIQRAMAAYRRARARIDKKDTTTNMKRSELALKRAINRLHVTDTQIQ